jgi:hypothetical protein
MKTLTCVTSFCCKSGSNGKTQPCYWLATNNNTRRKQKTERHNRIDKTHRKWQQGRTKRSGLTRSSPFTRLHRIIQYTPNAENPKRNFSY